MKISVKKQGRAVNVLLWAGASARGALDGLICVRFCLNEELRWLWLGKRRVMSGCGVSGWRRQCKGEGSPARRGQIWRVPYLVANRLKVTVYFVKNAINENQYKSAGSGRRVVVGGRLKAERENSPA